MTLGTILPLILVLVLIGAIPRCDEDAALRQCAPRKVDSENTT